MQQHPQTIGWTRQLRYALLTTLLLLALLEFGARIIERRATRVPPALVEALQGMGWQPNVADKRLLREDPHTLWSLVPDYEGQIPSYVDGGADWRVRIGPHGYRGAAPTASARLPRIACVGNSCTFGLLVDQGQTYPEQLAASLAALGRPAEVLNYGVPGFTSEQGRWVMEHDVLPAAPDLVILAFGFNDGWPAAISDRERLERERGTTARVRRALHAFALFRLLEARLQRIAVPPTAPLETAAERDRRVTTARLAENLHFMIDSAQSQGTQVLLLALDFPTGAAAEVVARVAAEAGVPFIDAREAFGAGCARPPLPPVVQALSAAPSTAASLSTPHELLLELAVPSSVPPPIGVVGNIPALGSGVPGRVLLADDGSGPDRRAGDGIYSLRIPAPDQSPVHYLFTCDEADSSHPRFESAVAVRTLDPAQPPQLMRFGRLPLMAEAIHPAAPGCQAIAWLVTDAIEQHHLLRSARVREAGS